MDSTVYIVTRPTENKFGWTPDLTDAARYGKMQVVFEPDTRPQFNPNKAIKIAREVMEDFGPKRLPALGRWIRSNRRNDLHGCSIRTIRNSKYPEMGNVTSMKKRDRRKGWYMPVKLDLT